MISIIDYGVGNVKAFLNIYKKLGHDAQLATHVDNLDDSTKLILPGVGHFDYAMKKFQDSGLFEKVNDLVLIQKMPVVGICVGMQMMARRSDEGSEKGLGWLEADVVKFDISKIKFKPHLPHMGWNDVEIQNPNLILTSFPRLSKFYFLHSYYMVCDHSYDVVAIADYGIKFSCIVNHENIFGVQCHPEKSHSFGVKLLDNFAKL
jgi:glutamine amidotransferase